MTFHLTHPSIQLFPLQTGVEVNSLNFTGLACENILPPYLITQTTAVAYTGINVVYIGYHLILRTNTYYCEV